MVASITRRLYSSNSLLSITLLLAVSPVAVVAQDIRPDASTTTPFLPNFVRTTSTVPANGDVNPYGVAFIPTGFPGTTVRPGDILVSNFNNSQNLQGTGTTIVRITHGDFRQSLFFQGKAPLGLSTALAALPEGLVIVGNFPSTDGTCPNASAGSLLVISSAGKLLQTITDKTIDGPWDMTVNDPGNGTAQAFVTNGLNGTVVRLDMNVSASGVTVKKATQIASGYKFQCDSVSFVDAPTGLAYDATTGNLYVASTVDNAIYRIASAGTLTSDGGTGTQIVSGGVLRGALAMSWAPNGDLLVSNNDIINGDVHFPSQINEFTTAGTFVKTLRIDPVQGGAFGMATQVGVGVLPANTWKFAAVDDSTSSLITWYITPPAN